MSNCPSDEDIAAVVDCRLYGVDPAARGLGNVQAHIDECPDCKELADDVESYIRST